MKEHYILVKIEEFEYIKQAMNQILAQIQSGKKKKKEIEMLSKGYMPLQKIAKLKGISPQTINKWRKEKGLQFSKIDRLVFVKIEDVDAFIDKNRTVIKPNTS